MDEIPRKQIFISHITGEKELAILIKECISKDFLGQLDVFVSSDSESIVAGSNFLLAIERTLSCTSLLIVLCSPSSIYRPWVNFELGAAWTRKIPIVPICHSGLRLTDLPLPLSLLQGFEAHNADGLKSLYRLIAELLNCTLPNLKFERIMKKIVAFQVRNEVLVERDKWIDSSSLDSRHRLLGQWRSTWTIEVNGELVEQEEVFDIQYVSGNRFFGEVRSQEEEMAYCECKLEGVWNDRYLQVFWSPPNQLDVGDPEYIDYGCYFLERQSDGSFEGYATGFFWNIEKVGTYRQTLTRIRDN